jgi:S1-C subfamily serine protease
MVHGWLGVEGADISSAQATAMGVEGGALVRAVTPGSPAEAAGLAPDDVITEVDGDPVGSISELVVELRDRDPGDDVTLGYWRSGEHAETTATLTERP